MIEICQIENIKDRFTIENMMLKLVDKLNIRRLVICIKDILEDKSQNRYSLMVFKNVLYKSKKKNHKPKEYIGGGDAYIASLIDGILKQKKDILDEADTYTIINQEKKGNFV